MKYLVAILDDVGDIEFAEIPTTEYWAFRDGLRESDCIQFDCVVIRAGELDRQKTYLSDRLRAAWEKREASHVE